MKKLNSYQKPSKSIHAMYEKILAEQPPLAMVDSEQGITNLHRPNDTIIDASMPAMIRSGGQMWNAKGELQPTKALIPDRAYGDLSSGNRVLQRAWCV